MLQNWLSLALALALSFSLSLSLPGSIPFFLTSQQANPFDGEVQPVYPLHPSQTTPSLQLAQHFRFIMASPVVPLKPMDVVATTTDNHRRPTATTQAAKLNGPAIIIMVKVVEKRASLVISSAVGLPPAADWEAFRRRSKPLRVWRSQASQK